ncbi:MAG: hypothetical protein ACJAVT_001427 [Yoonia sp.]
MIPWFDGAIVSQEWKEALWDKFVTAAPRTADRQWFAQQTLGGDARRQSCNTAIANFDLAAEQGVGHQSQDCLEVAQACDGGGFEDRAEGAALNSSHRSGGGNDRRIPAAHAPATG